MENVLRLTGGLLVIGALALGTPAAHAQTTGNGPYYPVPSWDQTLTCTSAANCPRFLVLSNFAGEAVMDRETGLVWERSPGDTDRDGDVDLDDAHTWADARIICAHRKTVGGRKGWRLPSFAELSSLIDPSFFFPVLLLPPGHPFGKNIQYSGYWSATTDADRPDFAAWKVSFGDGDVAPSSKTDIGFVWCVRGGMNADKH
jgi:hypothetical protein